MVPSEISSRRSDDESLGDTTEEASKSDFVQICLFDVVERVGFESFLAE
jgi:hypothetical protein